MLFHFVMPATEVSNHPFLNPQFYVPWSQLKADAVLDDIGHALRGAEQKIEAICSQDLSAASFESTFLALEEATEELGRGWGRLNHLDSVSDQPEQRAALNQMLPDVSRFYSSIALNDRLWRVIKEVGSRLLDEPLTDIQRRFVDETMLDFIGSGADLPEEKKQRIAEIDEALSQATKAYSEHVLDSTNAWECVVTDESRLAGLPDSAKAAAAENARTKGHPEPAWRFTLQFPSMFPLMQHADDDELRKEVWQASSQVASAGEHDNSSLVWQILSLRHEKAQILGQAHFADYVLQRRMAKCGKTALEFIEQLHMRVRPAFLTDYAQLEKFKAEATGHAEQSLAPWEVAYWAEKQRKALYDFDEELLRPYFPVDGVMAGMFEIASVLFGISIRQILTEEAAARGIETWHPECSVYEIHDRSSAAHLGSFYADWHPRESKRGGAWMNSLHTGGLGEPHLGLIIGNMTAPLDGKPALLTHREVETIFHEFGHLLHGLLSEVPIKSLAGTNVAWDFVELPSQLMENFCWDRASLNRFARHFETGEMIPDELFSKMLAAKNYMSGSGFMRQLAFAKLDLELHMHLDEWMGKDLDAVDREVLENYLAPLSHPTPSMLRRFNHLFSGSTGYAAGYYSYKWAEVLDADAFTRFQAEGVLNSEVGRAFRQHILSQGNSLPPDELFRRFMDRDPRQEPLLVRSGLAAAMTA